jgi:membrane carboxypeptidase/penicillin-binding protein
MTAALEGRPARPFHIPKGIWLVRVRLSDGLPADPGSQNVVLEAFKAGTEPKRHPVPVERGSPPPQDETGPKLQTVAIASMDPLYGGLY